MTESQVLTGGFSLALKRTTVDVRSSIESGPILEKYACSLLGVELGDAARVRRETADSIISISRMNIPDFRLGSGRTGPRDVELLTTANFGQNPTGTDLSVRYRVDVAQIGDDQRLQLRTRWAEGIVGGLGRSAGLELIRALEGAPLEYRDIDNP
jgi:hypothetical protein